MTNFEKESTCCFTGSRSLKKEDYQNISELVKKEVVSLYQKGITNFICGGALGFDTIAAITVINLKTVCPDIKLHLALPCQNHFSMWSDSEIAQFKTISKHSDSIKYVSQQYQKYCMFKRNRYMIDNSAHCISYSTKSKGGTAYTVNYANQKNIPVTELGTVNP